MPRAEMVGRYDTGRRVAGLVAATVLAGCGSSRPAQVAVAPAPVVVPAGVDSSVAAYADSVAEVSFVDLETQDAAAGLHENGRSMLARSDSVWLVLTALRDSTGTLAAEDSVRSREAATEGGRALVQLDRLLRASDLDPDSLARQTATLLDSAETALETAFRLNPFDTRSRLWLSRVYELQARRLGRAEAYHRAIEELEKLAVLTPDQHTVFAMLANNYYRLDEWDRAAANYRHAEVTYRETYDLEADQAAGLDSALLFTYVRAQGNMHVRRLDADRAAAAFDRALAYAPTADDSLYVAGEREWMAWDDMNIASSVARDSLAAAERDGDLAGAREGYRRLLDRLTAQRAIDEIDWRLAIVDYNLGHAEAAADRLHQLVARTRTDSLGVPVDSAYRQYLDDYGTLCLNLGRDFLHDRRDNRTALTYFSQATQVMWSGRAVAHLEIARLVQSNVAVALEHAGRALRDEAALTVPQRRQLYRLLMGLYRRSGDFGQARRFRDAYRSLESG